LSQANLAQQLGLTQAGLSLWETGARDLSYEQIHAVELALGLGLGTLGREAGFVVDVARNIAWAIRVGTVEEAVAAVRAAATLGLVVELATHPSHPAPADLHKGYDVVVLAPTAGSRPGYAS
jgi:transcriptional regulator with XRE-family HTH domain